MLLGQRDRMGNLHLQSAYRARHSFQNRSVSWRTAMWLNRNFRDWIICNSSWKKSGLHAQAGTTRRPDHISVGRSYYVKRRQLPSDRNAGVAQALQYSFTTIK